MKSLSIIVEMPNGEYTRVEFKPDFIDVFGTRGTIFKTEDKDLQKALEKHPFFKRALNPSFYTDTVVTEEAPAEEAPAEAPKKAPRKKTVKAE